MELNKILLLNLNKHFVQIRKGGLKVIIKKLRSFIYLLLQIPFYLMSIPLVFIIRLIKPWYLVRWHEIESGAMGYFTATTELYCCEKDAGINTPTQRFVDIFCLRKNVCNKQLEKMWRRVLIILPRWLLIPLFRVNRFCNMFTSGGNDHEIGYNTKRDQDVHNLIDKFPVHISFTDEEELKGKEILNKFGVPEDAKFICLNVRDSGYLSRRHEDHEYMGRLNAHNFRNADINKYILAAEELARRGYYVFRMGIKVFEPLKLSNPKIIDYANSEMRSAFMDIYLGAKCFFCISTRAGFDGIPFIFRRPIVSLCVPLVLIFTSSTKYLSIVKHHKYKKNQKELTISEIFSSSVATSFYTNGFDQNGVELWENSPEEIRDLAIEMDDRLNGNWNETKEDILLQEKFWSIFEENTKRLDPKIILNSAMSKIPNHGKIKARFGAKFLKENQNWIT